MTNTSAAPTPQRFSLTGKIIVLTGGAGLYGRGLTAQRAESGATLILASRNLSALEKVAAEERALGHHVQARSLDQAEESSVLQLCSSNITSITA